MDERKMKRSFCEMYINTYNMFICHFYIGVVGVLYASQTKHITMEKKKGKKRGRAPLISR